MFSLDEKFEYFLNIEKQVYFIIELNYNSPKPKIISKIEDLLEIQNTKTSFIISIDNLSEDLNSFTLSLKEHSRITSSSKNRFNYISGKKIFETKISLKSIIRGVRLNIIRNKSK